VSTRFLRLAGRFERFCVEVLASNGLHGAGRVWQFKWARDTGPFAGAWMHYELSLGKVSYDSKGNPWVRELEDEMVENLVPEALLVPHGWEAPKDHRQQPTVFAFFTWRTPASGQPIPLGWRTASNAANAPEAKDQAAQAVIDWSEGISTSGSNDSDGEGWSRAWIETRLPSYARLPRKTKRGRKKPKGKGAPLKSTRRGTLKPKGGPGSSWLGLSSRKAGKQRRSAGGKKKRT